MPYFQSKNIGSISGYILRDSAGNVIYTNEGQLTYVPDSYVPSIAAASFVGSYRADFDAYSARFLGGASMQASPTEAARFLLSYTIDQFRTNGPLDLQRSYNGIVSGGYEAFVSDFVPAASFAFGYSGSR